MGSKEAGLCSACKENASLIKQFCVKLRAISESNKILIINKFGCFVFFQKRASLPLLRYA